MSGVPLRGRALLAAFRRSRSPWPAVGTIAEERVSPSSGPLDEIGSPSATRYAFLRSPPPSSPPGRRYGEATRQADFKERSP